LLQYTQDYDEKWPCGDITPAAITAGLSTTTNFTGAGWAGQIYTYTKSAGVYKCLDDSTSNGFMANGTTQATPVSYAYNSNFSNAGSPITNASLQAPASTVVLAEAEGVATDVAQGNETTEGTATAFTITTPLSPAGNGVEMTSSALGTSDQTATWYTGPISGDWTTPIAGYTGTQGLHTGQSNYLMSDGHVKSYAGQQVSGGLTAAASTNRESVLPSTASGFTAAGTGSLYNGAGTQQYALTFSPT
jgi:prepilin-type processing-associated H-X9-DG protein